MNDAARPSVLPLSSFLLSFPLSLLLAATAAHAAPAQAHATDACSLLTPDQIKAVLSLPVQPGQPGGTKDAPDCTWRDAKGQDRVYLSLKTRDNFNVTRAQMQHTGRLASVTGIGEDAFFVSSTGSTVYLYTLGKKHLLLLSANGPNASKQENQASEKAIATEVLPKI